MFDHVSPIATLNDDIIPHFDLIVVLVQLFLCICTFCFMIVNRHLLDHQLLFKIRDDLFSGSNFVVRGRKYRVQGRLFIK